MLRELALLVCIIVNVFGSNNPIGIENSLQNVVYNGGDLTKLTQFIYDVNYYFNSNSSELQKNSLLVSNIMKLYPDIYRYYPTYLNTKMV